MATIKWEAPASPETLMSTDLNSLANSTAVLSAAISNNAVGELAMYADFELLVGAQAARGTDARVDMYFVITLDGTNYGYGDGSIAAPSTGLMGQFVLKSGDTAARYVHLTGVMLPPRDFKIWLRNMSGQAFAATGNVLKMSRYNLQSA